MAGIKHGWTLARLVWWSILWHASRHRDRRRGYRRRVISALVHRWSLLDANMDPWSPANAAAVLSLWLGSCLAARSLLRNSVRGRLAGGVRGRLVRILGHTGGDAVMAAYLAWRWVATADRLELPG